MRIRRNRAIQKILKNRGITKSQGIQKIQVIRETLDSLGLGKNLAIRITPEMMNRWLERKGVILRGGGLDEAPQAYRRLKDVLKQQGATIEVLHTLRPLVVVMAGANEFDPYKD